MKNKRYNEGTKCVSKKFDDSIPPPHATVACDQPFRGAFELCFVTKMKNLLQGGGDMSAESLLIGR